MSLPKIQAPIFTLTVPSTKKEVKFRPFTVKEEKTLLIAKESKDFVQIIDAMKQIIQNCVYGVDVEKLAIFDIEYIILQLRSKSVGNIVEFRIKESEDSDKMIDMSLNIDDIKIKYDEKHDPKIPIDGENYLIMRYPTINEITLIHDIIQSQNTLSMFNMMKKCIEGVANEEGIKYFEKYTNEEIDEFLDQLSTKTISKINEFFETIPKMSIRIPYKDSQGNDRVFAIEGTESFFI